MIALIEGDHRKDVADDHSGGELYLVHSRCPFVCFTAPVLRYHKNDFNSSDRRQYDKFGRKTL